MNRLVLFDIDETMLHSDGVGRRTMEAAMARIFGRSIDSTGHSMSGKTDPQICHEVLGAAGLDQRQIEEALSELYAIYVENLKQEIESAGQFELHEGVLELIEALESKGVYLALLTGNIEAGARLKLEPFDLNHRFKTGAFGCDAADRMKLPRIAHLRAQEVFGVDFAIDNISILGDAENDVLCAKGYGVRSLAVATGRTPKQTLADLCPDHLFDSLKDTESVLQAVL